MTPNHYAKMSGREKRKVDSEGRFLTIVRSEDVCRAATKQQNKTSKTIFKEKFNSLKGLNEANFSTGAEVSTTGAGVG